MKDLILKVIYKILAVYARKVIAKHNPFIIAISGSVGKTSTKEAVYTVLRDNFGDRAVRKTAGNLNAEIGIPLTILGYERLPKKYFWPVFLLLAARKIFASRYPKYLVLEMGVEHKGDINYFSSIVKPDIAILTSTSPAHLANFNSLSEFQQEKVSLIYNLKSNGIGIVNGDDPTLSKLRSERIKTISLEHKESDFFIENYELGFSGTEYRVSTLGQKISVKSKLLGKQMIYAGLFGFAVGKVMDCPLLQVAKSLESIKPFPGRMNLLGGRNQMTIIDDTYNANPASTKAALDTLAEMKYAGRKIAIIGNMNELGKLEKEAHLEIAGYARGKCDFAIFAGPNAEAMSKTFGESKSRAFSGRAELVKNIDSLLLERDLVLIKASQNKNFFEEIVKQLLGEPNQSKKLLVRQDSFWLRRKNSY